MAERRVLLGVFAHPDDESFGPGATLARYAAEGAAVHVIIATDGIAGSVEQSEAIAAQVKSHESLAQLRSAELSRAAVALGVTAIYSLPYRDSGMRGDAANDHPDALIRQPLAHTVAEVLGYIERIRPQVILTHDPYGGYGHPDHVRCCEATTAAFYLARGTGRPDFQPDGFQPDAVPQKLYYTSFPKAMMKVMVRLMPLARMDPTRIGRNADINLVEIAQWDTPVTTAVRVADYQAAKEVASMAHASQYGGGPGWMKAIPGPLRKRVTDYDRFTRAYPGAFANGSGKLEDDLFAGVRV